jgi:hypothetical protein
MTTTNETKPFTVTAKLEYDGMTLDVIPADELDTDCHLHARTDTHVIYSVDGSNPVAVAV